MADIPEEDLVKQALEWVKGRTQKQAIAELWVRLIQVAQMVTLIAGKHGLIPADQIQIPGDGGAGEHSEEGGQA